MKRAHLPAVVLLAAALPAGGAAHAQARGPSAAEILEDGQDILSGREKREVAFRQAREQAMEQAVTEREELLDPAVRARKAAELHTWFRRLPGRFRIEGRIEKPEFRMGTVTVVSDKVTGVADCTGIGEGVGVQCILNATWRTIETEVPPIGSTPPASEMLRTFNPAVLVIGLNLDPPGIRAQMVNADSLSHTWVGKLAENTASANRLNRALPARRIQPLQIIAEPESEVVTILLRSGSMTLTLTMNHDPEARAEKPLKPLKAR